MSIKNDDIKTITPEELKKIIQFFRSQNINFKFKMYKMRKENQHEKNNN